MRWRRRHADSYDLLRRLPGRGSHAIESPSTTSRAFRGLENSLGWTPSAPTVYLGLQTAGTAGMNDHSCVVFQQKRGGTKSALQRTSARRSTSALGRALCAVHYCSKWFSASGTHVRPLEAPVSHGADHHQQSWGLVARGRARAGGF